MCRKLLLLFLTLLALTEQIKHPKVNEEFFSGFAPFIVALDPIGQLPNENPEEIRFYLFNNPKSINKSQEIIFGNVESLERLRYRPDAPWKFLIHGFLGNLHTSEMQNIKNAYLKRMRMTNDSYNVVIVDWGHLAYNFENSGVVLPLYNRAVKNVIPAGDRVAQLIYFLFSNKVISNLRHVHLIGFSLGSHVSGEAGYWLQNKLRGRQIGRITGLDPAGPLFYTNDVSRRLENSDAAFVDCYHTNPGGFGIDMDIGDADFYPNIRVKGQNRQPQCLIFAQKEANHCSHLQAPNFFAWALLKKIFAQGCMERAEFNSKPVCSPERVLYGNDIPTSASGNYFVEITENLDDSKLYI